MPDEPRIWFITGCMGRLSALEQSLPTFCRQSSSRVVVVDYSCPDRSGDWVEAHHPECQVVRVPDEEFFHSSRARNVGFQVVPPGDAWVCFVDLREQGLHREEQDCLRPAAVRRHPGATLPPSLPAQASL